MNRIKLCQKCLDEYSPQKENGVRVLRTFNGHTIDLRLQQFRKVPIDDLPEFIEFDSKEGLELLKQMHLALVN